MNRKNVNLIINLIDSMAVSLAVRRLPWSDSTKRAYNTAIKALLKENNESK